MKKPSPQPSDESPTLPTSGSEGSVSTKTSETAPGLGRTVRLKSLLEGGGDCPGLSMYIPAKGQIFEAEAWQGRALLECGYAEVAGETAKGE